MNPTYSSVEIRTLCTYRLYPRPLSLTQFTRRLAQLDTGYRPRFFDQVGHQTTYAYIKNKHFSLNHVIVRPTKIMNNLKIPQNTQ